jgi:hypothetical protein
MNTEINGVKEEGERLRQGVPGWHGVVDGVVIMYTEQATATREGDEHKGRKYMGMQN